MQDPYNKDVAIIKFIVCGQKSNVPNFKQTILASGVVDHNQCDQVV